MRSSYLVAIALGGCGFSSKVDPSHDAPNSIDSAIDAPGTVTPDARVCFGSGFGMTCVPTPPPNPRLLSDTTMFDTGNAGICTHTITITGTEACVLTGTTITLENGLTFRAAPAAVAPAA